MARCMNSIVIPTLPLILSPESHQHCAAVLNRNQFGGTISGPMVLPNFGEGGKSVSRGKAFFFFNMESSVKPRRLPELQPRFCRKRVRHVHVYR